MATADHDLPLYATEHRRLVQDHVDAEAGAALRRAPSSAFRAVAIGVGFLLPTVAVGLYLVIALCWPCRPARSIVCSAPLGARV